VSLSGDGEYKTDGEPTAGSRIEDINILGIESINQDLFDRQKRLKGWNQEKIRSSTVLVVGAGATGNELVKNLVLMGIGTIYLVDYDTVDRSNLNRCVFFKEADAERKNFKSEIVARNAMEYGRTKVIPLVKKIEEVDEAIYKECNVVASCLDNMEARLQANSYSYAYRLPFVDSGIDGFYGSIFCVIPQDKECPCIQCSMSSVDLDNMFKKFSCTGQEIAKEEGFTEMKMANIITTTSIIGALQAQQIVKIILGLDSFVQNGTWNEAVGPPVYGKELRYDGTHNSFTFIEKTKNPSCWICNIPGETRQPLEKPIAIPAEKPAKRPAKRAAKRAAKPPAEKPVAITAEKPAKRPAKRAAKRAAKPPAEKPVAMTAEKPAKRPAKRAAKQSTKQSTENPIETIAEKPDEEPTTKPAEKPAMKPGKKPSKKPAKKPAKKSTKKSLEKTPETTGMGP